MSDETEQSTYHVSMEKLGPLWIWHGWRDGDDEWSSSWGRGIHLRRQNAIWAARRKMIGRIVRAHARSHNSLCVDGDELVALADADHATQPLSSDHSGDSE